MSSNRLMYDTCGTQTRFNESVTPLQYILDPVKYDNCKNAEWNGHNWWFNSRSY